MVAKGFGLSRLSVAIAATLGIAAAITPDHSAFGSTMSTAARPSSHAIVGTGAHAIVGTGTRKSASTQAIVGTGAHAIVGTGTRKSASTQAIVGTGAHAIVGTGARKLVSTEARTAATVNAKTIVAVRGPVESVNAKAGTVRILARTFGFPANSMTFQSIQQNAASGQVVQAVVVAKLSRDGTLVGTRLRFLPTEYIAGVTEVVTSGRVKSIDTRTGKAVVGGTLVDYTSLLSTQSVTLGLGDVVVVVGTQPMQGGAVLASQLTKVGN